ncbi:MAG: hypothetical protein SGARI_002980 [Bacillariaceae sp.]
MDWASDPTLCWALGQSICSLGQQVKRQAVKVKDTSYRWDEEMKKLIVLNRRQEIKDGQRTAAIFANFCSPSARMARLVAHKTIERDNEARDMEIKRLDMEAWQEEENRVSAHNSKRERDRQKRVQELRAAINQREEAKLLKLKKALEAAKKQKDQMCYLNPYCPCHMTNN